MARTGRPKTETLTLTTEERAALERLAARPRSGRHMAFRAKIILLCAEGTKSNKDVARELRVGRGSVGKWRSRLITDRLDGLHDEPRQGAARKITDDAVEAAVTKTLESTPRGRTHWSTRSMAKNVGLSHSSIGRIWRAFGLQPHRSETLRISQDPLLVEKVRDIVGLYMSPPDNAVVLCIDEKSQILALERAQPILPMDIGRPERRTPDYIRHGTTDLFAALDVATGQVIGKCYQQHRAKDLRAFLREVEKSVPTELEVHVVIDNLSAHKVVGSSWQARRRSSRKRRLAGPLRTWRGSSPSQSRAASARTSRNRPPPQGSGSTLTSYAASPDEV